METDEKWNEHTHKEKLHSVIRENTAVLTQCRLGIFFLISNRHLQGHTSLCCIFALTSHSQEILAKQIESRGWVDVGLFQLNDFQM